VARTISLGSVGAPEAFDRSRTSAGEHELAVGPGVPSFDPGGGLSFTPREDLVAAVAADDDQVLCGALAPACP